MPIKPDWNSVATQTAASAGGGILGMVFGGINDRRQLRQQKKLNELENKQTDYNYKKQLEMWNATGYEAQKEQLKNAGLNPGLLYGMGGGGGQTANVSTASGSGGKAPTGGGEIQAMMGMGLQMQLLKAQKENIEADTEKKKADAAATAGIQTDVGKQNIEESKQRVQNLMQGLDNSRNEYEIQKLQMTMQNIENFEKQASQEDRLDYIQWQAKQAEKQLEQITNEVYVSSATRKDKINMIKAEAIGSVLRNEAIKTGIQVDKQTASKIANEIMRDWDKMSQTERQIRVQEKLADWNTDPNREATNQALDIIEEIMRGASRR